MIWRNYGFYNFGRINNIFSNNNCKYNFNFTSYTVHTKEKKEKIISLNYF